ncbi:hypothetical protein PVK06_009193 [Gossypium arboreum]|uniref:Uncharacterized protein n=1 Tax=Gossypium arboreum TaxID=29729 RepID=A0ABR0QM47_GOSAR|nr:hypothetical protein PVK06_009193 [Gossypium arboreum]
MNGSGSLSNNRVGDNDDFNKDCNTKKVRFKDGEDVSSENMVVDMAPVSGVSWKDKLLGRESTGSLASPTISINSLDVDLKFEYGDILRSTLNKILAINFSERFKRILVKDMETTIIVKLLGCNIGYGVLYNQNSSLWKPSQTFQLMDVEMAI